MPQLEISCDCKSYCLTQSMSFPEDLETIYEIMENCLEGIEDDEEKIEELEDDLDLNIGHINSDEVLNNMKKYLRRKALSMYVISLIAKYEKCSYISSAMSKDAALSTKYLELKLEHADILAEAMSCSTEQLKKKFLEYC